MTHRHTVCLKMFLNQERPCTVLMMFLTLPDLFFQPSENFGQKYFVTDRHTPSQSHLRAHHSPRSCLQPLPKHPTAYSPLCTN